MNEKTNAKTVLIAMTGGIESTVAAYLLKKQGYKCIGIGVKLFSDGEYAGPFEEAVISDLGKVKSICEYLDIPFYAVDASEEFLEKVLDPVVGRILSGHTFEPIVFLNLVIFDILIDKAKKFNTKLIATGHYAKVLKNQRTGDFELMTANDIDHDQSYFLARLGKEHFENLILPLSEIRKKEVQKIGELIKVQYTNRPKNVVHHIMRDPKMIKLVEARSPKDLRRVGSLYDYRSESSLCEHIGVHHYYIGKNNLSPKPEIPIDPNKMVIQIVPFKGNVFIDLPDKLKFTHALISKLKTSDNFDVTKPLSAYVKMTSGDIKIPCKIFFKNNDSCVVEFDSTQGGLLIPGQFFVFYNKSADKAKIIGSGIVEFGGVFENGEYNTLPIYKDNHDEDDKKNIKKSNRLQF